MEVRDKEVIREDLRKAEQKVRDLEEELKSCIKQEVQGYLDKYLSFKSADNIYYFRASRMEDANYVEPGFYWFILGPGFCLPGGDEKRIQTIKEVCYTYSDNSKLQVITKEEYNRLFNEG